MLNGILLLVALLPGQAAAPGTAPGPGAVPAPAAISRATGEDSAYGQYLKSLRPLSFDFETSTFETGGAVGEVEKQVAFARGTFRVLGNEGRYYRRERSLILREGSRAADGSTLRPQDIETEDVVTARLRLHLEARYRTGDVEAEFEMKKFPNAVAAYSAQSWERVNSATAPLGSREVNSAAQPARARPTFMPGMVQPTKLEHLDSMLQVLFGQLACDNGKDIPSLVFFGRSVATHDDKVDIFAVKHIVGNSVYGTYAVWLDPIAGNGPRKIDVRKSGHHVVGERLLRDTMPPRVQGDRRPYGALTDYRFQVDKVNFELLAGREQPVMNKFEIVESRGYRTGAKFQQRTVVKLSNLSTSFPALELEPTMSLPEGTPVRIVDAPNTKAEWRNRAVFKIAAEGDLKPFETVDLAVVRPPRNPWLITLNAIVLLGLVAAWFARRKRAAAAGAA